ncbi:hypothetical protein O181_118811 [Austropuccinia psidii MF-1]|uniref:Uncharacterized protein n=1 Tax=Austropuccinia psidii MF-1 TaxID=1389203 RepID=A0A9Q3PZ48_9BASI|nr:hypothetical protein [Austropuccinia psidii MF-1]
MPTLAHELDSAPSTNNLRQRPIFSSTPATAPLQSPILMLTHPHIVLSSTYCAYNPAALSQYDSNATTPSPA